MLTEKEEQELEPIFMAVLPLPPSTNDLHNPTIRQRGERAYATKVNDPAVTAYELQVRSILNNPRQRPWRSWQDTQKIRAIQRDKSIKLELELWEYFKEDRSDYDNRIKCLQDILARHLEINDKRISDGSQHKRVHKECAPCIVAILRIAMPFDIWQEQAELDDMFRQLTEGANEPTRTAS
jgi:Holliday junction resolvase RusA-like endonuclease